MLYYRSLGGAPPRRESHRTVECGQGEPLEPEQRSVSLRHPRQGFRCPPVYVKWGVPRRPVGALATDQDAFLREVFWPIADRQIEFPERFLPGKTFIDHHRRATSDLDPLS